MAFLGRLASGFDAWRESKQRSDVNEHGVGRGNYSTNDGNHTYNDYGITDRQQEILNAFREGGWRNAAAVCGISKNGVYRVLEDIADRWGLDQNKVSDIVDTYNDLEAGVYTADQLSPNYTDTSVEGGNHPWQYDHEGNRID
jgi:hypothetical protein